MNSQKQHNGFQFEDHPDDQRLVCISVTIESTEVKLGEFHRTVAGFFYDNLQKFEGKMEGQVMWQLVKTMKDTNAQLMQLCFFHENYLKIKEEANTAAMNRLKADLKEE